MKMALRPHCASTQPQASLYTRDALAMPQISKPVPLLGSVLMPIVPQWTYVTPVGGLTLLSLHGHGRVAL
jgi:hypothetical protein